MGKSELREYARELQEEIERLQGEVSTDDLTGVLTRKYFIRELGDLIYRSHREDKMASAGVIDIDYFKQYNRDGHELGDRVLKGVAEAGRRVLRQYDLIGRYGGDKGDEFLAGILGWEINGKNIIDRWRREVGTIEVPPGFTTVTITGGVADLNDSPEIQLLRGKRGTDAIMSYKEGEFDRAREYVGVLADWLKTDAKADIDPIELYGALKRLDRSARDFMESMGAEGDLVTYLEDPDFRYPLAATILTNYADRALMAGKRKKKNRIWTPMDISSL
ncbi:MAG: GGDEF domain-containing protein [Candidatus Aenigmatarchaeota archaeon]|nr:MAG: GGDEF domain-containing protein [Candidatus Aenigmarchaeota archaeon]